MDQKKFAVLYDRLTRWGSVEVSDPLSTADLLNLCTMLEANPADLQVEALDSGRVEISWIQ